MYNLDAKDLSRAVDKILAEDDGKIMRIRKLRQSAGLSQKQVTELMGIGRETLRCWDREISFPNIRNLPQLAQVLGCNVRDLFEFH